MSVTMGGGRFSYQVRTDWAKLPAGWRWPEVADVAVDSRDRVYVFSRSEHPLAIFDRQGNLLDSWGEGLFSRPHGLTLGPDESLYLADDLGHVIRRYSREGELLATLGRPGQPAEFMSGRPFNQPTKAVVDPGTVELYVSDGYGNARVHKYSPTGELILSWGESGTDPGQFNLVHGLALDCQGRVFVADRENHRIQIFDGRGNYLEQWNNLHRPCALHITGGPEQLVLVGELPTSLAVNEKYPNIGARVSVFDLRGRRLARLGDIRPGEAAHQFIAPHGLAMDSHGDLYVAEVSWSFRGRDLDPPRELPCFRKLVRLA